MYYIQVTVDYKEVNGVCIPQRVHTVVVSTQHAAWATQQQIRDDLKTKLIPDVIPSNLLDDKTVFHLNPSGAFVTGGPMVKFIIAYSGGLLF